MCWARLKALFSPWFGLVQPSTDKEKSMGIEFHPHPGMGGAILEIPVGRHFTMRDLTKTSLPYSNVPDDATLERLKQWGPILDYLYDHIGPFTVASGYRSPDNQGALKGGAQGTSAAAMAASHSYHSTGEALDINPVGMSLDDYFTKMIADRNLDSMIGQIVNKKEGGQNSLHISLITAKFPKATPMYVGDDGQYYRFTGDQIADWLKQHQKKLTIVGLAMVALGVFTLIRFAQLRGQGNHSPTLAELFMVEEMKGALKRGGSKMVSVAQEKASHLLDSKPSSTPS